MNDFLILFLLLTSGKSSGVLYAVPIEEARHFQKMKRTSPKRSTIAAIAAQAGVSIPTVSRVLNGRPDVAPATRERIEQIIKERGYVHSSADKLLRKSNNGTILGLDRGQSSRLDELRRRGIPFVVVDHRGELGPDGPSVGTTNWTGGRVAVEYLLSLGHRRIAMIAGPASLRCSLDRVAGYRAALEAAGIPIDPELIRPGDFRLQSGYTQTSALLALPHPPTAIFAGNDLQAMGVYKALYLRNVHVPEHMSVIGFDDIPLTTIVSPSLTTVRQPLFDMGRVATTMLLRLIAGVSLDSSRVLLPTTLITRESCASSPSLS